jgi:hypothetical protein
MHVNPRTPRFLALAAATTLVCGGSARAQPNEHNAVPVRTAAVAAMNQLLASDMEQPSEKLPEGVPTSYDWARGPRVHPVASTQRFRAFTAWGQLYQCAGTSASRGQAVQLRDMQTWVLPRGSSRWRRIQLSSALQGAAFAEAYDGPTVAAHYVASASGTVVQPVAHHNFHFWPGSGRVSLRPRQVSAIVVAVRARLQTPSDATVAPCLVLSVGGDLWRSLRAEPGTGNTADIGIGRFKRVERRWRLFTMTTASSATLTRSPLPVIAPTGDDF